MKREDAVKLSDDGLAELAASLAEGRSDALTGYLEAMSRFHDYSFGNCLLIVKQRPTATLVAGFHAWKKRGRSVMKGERGICILAPMVRKSEDEGEESKTVYGYRAVHVFDVAQTEGDELPDINRIGGDPGESLARLHAAAGRLGVEVGVEDHLDGADGVSTGGRVYLLRELSPAASFCTLAHELAHELLHRGEDRKSLTKMVKELEAESVAYVVSRAVGLDNALAQSTDYIHCHGGDSASLAKSLQRIQQTAAAIIEQLVSVTASTHAVQLA